MLGDVYSATGSQIRADMIHIDLRAARVKIADLFELEY
jgi:hypothetical protein